MSSIEENLSTVPHGRTLDGAQAATDDTALRRLPPDPTPSHRLRLAAILRAASLIDPVFTQTPQFEAAALGEALGISTVVKIETANPIRCFKGRGAEFFMHERPSRDVLVAASAGNFGQGLAWAARRAGTPLVIYSATTANPRKLQSMRLLGADVRLAGHDVDAAKAVARQEAQQHGWRFVEDGADPEIAEGAGTIGIELAEMPMDTVVLPMGNGAFVTGVGRWLKAVVPAVEVVAVCAAGAPSMALSFRAGEPVASAEASTAADGIAVREPVPEAVADLRGTVDDVVTVTEQSLRRAAALSQEHLGMVAELSGSAGIAALLEHHERFAGRRVATVLCGSNTH